MERWKCGGIKVPRLSCTLNGVVGSKPELLSVLDKLPSNCFASIRGHGVTFRDGRCGRRIANNLPYSTFWAILTSSCCSTYWASHKKKKLKLFNC